MSATAPSAIDSNIDTSEWPESYVRNGYSEQRGGDILFTTTLDGHYVASLDGYAIIPIEKYFALINEPLPERIVQALGLQPYSRNDESPRELQRVPVWIHPRDIGRSAGDCPVPCRDSALHDRLSDHQDMPGSGSRPDKGGQS